MKLLIIVTIMAFFCHSAMCQPWSSRFDYNDYQPVPISPSHLPLLVPRRPMRMLASPRYRPDAMEHPHHHHQRRFNEDPFLQHPQPPVIPESQIAEASAFGGSYFQTPSPNFETRTPESNGVSDFMSRLATALPEIAGKMAALSPNSVSAEKPKFNAGFYTFSPQTEASENANGGSNINNFGGSNADFLGNVKKSGLGMFFVTDPSETEKNAKNDVANVVDSMPGPNSLFSFNKLFSAFAPTTPTPPTTAFIDFQKDRKIYDMRQIKGTPILKDEDESTEFIQKPDEFISAAPTSTEIIPTSSQNPAENLLGTILSGKIDQVDWLGAIFNKNSIPGAGEQNPITQLFKGGIFGSGLDDDAASSGKITKSQDTNFN